MSTRDQLEVYIDHENSKAMFKQLKAHQAEIDAALALSLTG